MSPMVPCRTFLNSLLKLFCRSTNDSWSSAPKKAIYSNPQRENQRTYPGAFTQSKHTIFTWVAWLFDVTLKGGGLVIIQCMATLPLTTKRPLFTITKLEFLKWSRLKIFPHFSLHCPQHPAGYYSGPHEATTKHYGKHHTCNQWPLTSPSHSRHLNN